MTNPGEMFEYDAVCCTLQSCHCMVRRASLYVSNIAFNLPEHANIFWDLI